MTASASPRVVAVLLLMCIALAMPPMSPSSASDEASCVSVGWAQVDADCPATWKDVQSASASLGLIVVLQCGNGGICDERVMCVEDGEQGFMHDVFRDGEDIADVCVPNGQLNQESVATLVLREFRTLDWKASRLVVQPKGGRTLVNFQTNFYTPDNATLEKQVTIAGQDVVIHATPVDYTYVFGDGDSTSTPSPGGAYPNLDVTHEYAKTDTFEVRLDTTYAGEFRIGDGEWTPIAETLTVAGQNQELEVLEALPQLVNR